MSVDKNGVDWPAVTAQIMQVLSGTSTLGSVSVPVVDLLDEQVDLTPARRVPRTRAATIVDLRRLWTRFDEHMRELRDAADALSASVPADSDETVPLISVGELERAGGSGNPDQAGTAGVSGAPRGTPGGRGVRPHGRSAVRAGAAVASCGG
ncbi:hypothetical protein GCM10010405_27650 [Streptomyces macrosporus]|uniref:Uncharacterized protein n=1 Tax=Streptomyces macrosporus TaxID=44032 RepID=A0ABN3JWW1_9ACTN